VGATDPDLQLPTGLAILPFCRVITMDSNEMRLRAKRCRRQADATFDITARAALIKTAVTWETLAKRFEKLWSAGSQSSPIRRSARTQSRTSGKHKQSRVSKQGRSYAVPPTPK
jgi:hypothetical protein